MVGEEVMEPMRRIRLLRDWRSLINEVSPILRKYGAECYVFGSVVTGRVTGSSDVDILLVIDRGGIHWMLRSG